MLWRIKLFELKSKEQFVKYIVEYIELKNNIKNVCRQFKTVFFRMKNITELKG